MGCSTMCGNATRVKGQQKEVTSRLWESLRGNPLSAETPYNRAEEPMNVRPSSRTFTKSLEAQLLRFRSNPSVAVEITTTTTPRSAFFCEPHPLRILNSSVSRFCTMILQLRVSACSSGFRFPFRTPTLLTHCKITFF